MIWPIPPFDSQNSNGVDIDDCVEESLPHIAFGLTGIRYSPRALASLMYAAGKLNSNGSSTDDALVFANQYGLVPYENWPTPDVFTLESYLSPVPPEVLATAHFYAIKKIDPNLNKSPLWTQLSFPHPTGSLLHWVCQFNSTQYMDSEAGGTIKLLNYGGAVVLSQHSLEFIKKGNFMLAFFQVPGQPTVWLLENGEWSGFSDITAFNKYLDGREFKILPIPQISFEMLKTNPDVYKT